MTTDRETRGGRRAAPPKRKVSTSRVKTVRTPTVLQMEAVECGAASLAMVLGHYGRHVPLEELRIACGVSRDGSRASNLLKAARSYGLTAKGMQMDLAALAEVTAPAVLFWEFNHYVVYDGMGRRFGRRGVYINDPGKGRRFVPLEEFDGSFTGVVLVMEPGEDFTRGGRRPGVLGAMPARLRGTAGTMPAVVLSSLLLVAVGAAVPGLSRTFIDEFLIGGRTSMLGVLFTSMGVCVLLTLVLTWLQQGNLLRGRLISSTLSSARFLRHLLRLPVTFFAQRSPADLVQRLQSNDAVAETLARDLSAAGVDAVVVVLYAVLLYTYDPQLTFVGIGVALLNIVAMRIVIRLRATRTAKLRADSARLTNTAYTGLQLIETLKATGGEDGYFRKWAGQHATTLEEQQRLGVPSAWLGVVAPTLATLNSALILWIGGMRAVEGHISVGLLVAFQALVARFTAPLTRLNGVAGRIQDFAADVARLKDVENFPGGPAVRASGRR
ncbi:ABC-type bacteriocin/lantibiotic exporter with double-glycine peptidase domain [Streptomyces sp. SAI-229]